MHLRTVLFSALFGAILTSPPSPPPHPGPFNLLKLNLEFIDRCKELSKFIIDQQTSDNWNFRCRNSLFRSLFSDAQKVCQDRYGREEDKPDYQPGNATHPRREVHTGNGTSLGAIVYSDLNIILTGIYPLSRYYRMIDEFESLKHEFHAMRYTPDNYNQSRNPLLSLDRSKTTMFFQFTGSQRLLNETFQTGSVAPLGRMISGLERLVCSQEQPSQGCNVSDWRVHSCQANYSETGGFSLEILVPTDPPAVPNSFSLIPPFWRIFG